MISIFPFSILDMSRISLMRDSRYWEEDSIFFKFVSTRSGSRSSIQVRFASPMIAFMGVRISWLILDRNSPLALLWASAFSSSPWIMAFRSRAFMMSRTDMADSSTNALKIAIKATGLA